jgi:hypothetical protein
VWRLPKAGRSPLQYALIGPQNGFAKAKLLNMHNKKLNRDGPSTGRDVPKSFKMPVPKPGLTAA